MSDHLHATFVPDCWRCDLARDEVREIQHLALTDSTSTRDRAAWRLARIAEDETVALNDAVLRAGIKALHDDHYCEFSIGVPSRFWDDNRVSEILETAIEAIEALEPDRDWDAILVATRNPSA